MRRYLLDTAPLAALMHARPAAVNFLTPLLKRREVATSILVYAEVTEYIKGLPDFSTRYEHLKTSLRPARRSAGGLYVLRPASLLGELLAGPGVSDRRSSSCGTFMAPQRGRNPKLGEIQYNPPKAGISAGYRANRC